MEARRAVPDLATPGDGSYAVVQLVADEMHKDLIGAQVVDHMMWQASADAPDRPASVTVGFLEAARNAIRSRSRRRLRELRLRAPAVRMIVLPYSSRVGVEASARWNALRLRRLTGGRPAVFHCRGESALEWALALRRHFTGAGLVADIRGPWAEELLFARGYDGPQNADDLSAREYQRARRRLAGLLTNVDVVLTVSPGMVEWLEDVGVTRGRVAYVPCCVSRVTFSEEDRRRVRAELGLGDRLVFVYLGSATPYQYLKDGVAPFFRLAAERADTHLLVLTPDAEAMRGLLSAAGVPDGRVTIRRVANVEVPAFLAASDAGLLLSEPHRLASVVQPVKLGEYLAAGVPVVVSRGATHVARMIERSGAGLVLEPPPSQLSSHARTVEELCERLRREGGRMRRAAVTLCEQELTWSRYTAVVRQAYRRALSHGAESV